MSTAISDMRTAVIAKITANLASFDATWLANQNVAWPGVHFVAAAKSFFMGVELPIHSIKQAAIGSPVEYIEGAVELTFFAQQGQGTSKVAQYTDAARTLFAMRSTLAFGSGGAFMTFRSPTPQPPHDGDQEFVIGAVVCPFYTYT